MGVYKEIPKADGSGITTFYRLSTENATVETTSTGSTETMFDYNNVLNKPSINDVVLIGNKTSADLGLQPAGNYITEIPEEYIIESELEAKDYATKTYVLEQLNNTEHFHREIVDALPLTGKDNVLYLVAKKGTDKDIYNEYIWTGTDYELLGTTATDLSDYYKKPEVDNLIDTRVKKETGKGLSTNDYTTAEKTKLASLENYDDSEIKSQLNQLHNYDDTDIKNDIIALKTAENGLKTDVSDIKEELKDKIEGVRLVRSGDMWDFYTVGGTRLTYESARELLGHPNTILYMEGVENDGKTTPADYDIDEELIHVHYMDEDGEDRYLQMGYPNTASAEGSYIHIEDAVAQPISELKVDGASEQKTYTGKNLLNYIDNLFQNPSGLTNTLNPDGSITTTGKPTMNYATIIRSIAMINLLEDKQVYTISQEKPNGKVYIQINAKKSDGTYTYYNSSTGKLSFTVDKSLYTGYTIVIQTPTMSVWGDKSLTITNKYMLCKGTDTADTSFEPYTGKQPSPNPDYPQEIVNVKGKNLFKPTLATTVLNGITCTANENGTYILNGTATANTTFTIGTDENLIIGKTYKFVGCPNGGSNKTYRMGWTFHNYEYGNGLISKKTTEARHIQITIFKGITVSNLIFKPMFTENTLLTYNNYVPYGNIQIVKTGKNLFKSGIKTQTSNGLTITYSNVNSSEATIKGTALINWSNISSNITDLLPAGTYTLSISTPQSFSVNLKGNFEDGSVFEYEIPIGQLSKTFTITKNVKRRYAYIGLLKAGDTIDADFKIQLEKGTVATGYEPYVEKVVNIDLKGNELCSLPNGTKDELVIENNRVKVNKKIGKVLLDGSESWIIPNPAVYPNLFLSNKTDLIHTTTTGSFVKNMLCDHLIWQNVDNVRANEGICVWKDGAHNFIRINKSNITTVADFKLWLQANPLTLSYELGEPETIDLGEIDMPATFEGVNNITTDSDLSPNIKINYITNVNYLDKNIGFKNHYIGYYEDVANLPAGNKGDIATVTSDKRIYINDGNEWIPSDKNSTIDLSNYLAKDNTTGYVPTGNYNPATKKYVDDSVKGINIPTKTSQLINDSNFVIKTTNELTNYYTKNNTYTKNEVNALVAGGGGGSNVSITVNGDTLVITTK